MDTSSNSGPGSRKPINEELVSTAVRFLINDKVHKTSLDQKRDFLTKKGLSEQEIDLALSRAEFSINQPELVQGNPSQPRGTSIRDIASIAIVLSGASYGAFKLIRNWILPHFFGALTPEQDEMRGLGERVDELQDSLKFVLDSMQQTHTALNRQNELIERVFAQSSLQSQQDQMVQLKNEISVVKSLLLGKSQFPPVPIANGPPSWQIQKETKNNSGGSSECNGHISKKIDLESDDDENEADRSTPV